ncbi:polysaccharide biosynthesis tyrosine autokinase [Sphingomonas naphthae]|uniref:non-specific protein-tyrosine kinase n=1 Tax=Sphingomonas naphthae TaxID=1813468 RepID=A0ABY7THR5_9SPHN|nr:polysaccharide biosynthesis tyrosine autokinase [Sphingomonas naphthae]WCT72531.1 polysaccharide biosynthesis tyrosine autokinase [Sphingomonas naphthae]
MTEMLQDIPTYARPIEELPQRRLLPDPSYIWTVFRRHIKLALLVAAVVVAAIAIRVVTLQQVYSATATVLIEPRKTEVVKMDSVVPDIAPSSDIVDTEVRILNSPTLAARVAARLNAQGLDIGRFTTDVDKRRAAARLLRQVQIERSGLTLVIDITASTAQAEQSAAIANAFAEEYIDSQRDAKRNATRDASKWLDLRLVDLRASASQADAALQRYRIANGLMSAQGATMAEQEVSALNQQISLARAELAEKQGALATARSQLRRGGQGADVGAALGSNTIGNLRQREAEVSQNLAQLETRYGDLHPDVKTARSQLADIRSQIQKEIDRILSSLEAEAAVAGSRLSSLQSSQGRATGALAANSSAQVGLGELERRADASKQVYQAFLNRSKETAAQEGLQQADARISAFATVPLLPSFPNYKLAGLFAVVAALFAILVTTVLAEYLQRGVATKDDVERRLRLRYAGAVPSLDSTLEGLRSHETPQDYIVSHPFSSFAEAFRSLRAFVTLSAANARVIALASALPQEGKTTTSMCLARSAAMAGSKVVLVDCDLRRRGVSATLGVTNDGVTDVLLGKGRLEDGLFDDPLTPLKILGTSDAPTTANDPLTPENLQRLVAELKVKFDLVILDTAPLLGVADARAVASVADAVVMVTRWRKTSRNAAEAAIELLADAGAKVAGMALTMVDIRKYASTGQTDSYGYHKRFSSYYRN